MYFSGSLYGLAISLLTLSIIAPLISLEREDVQDVPIRRSQSALECPYKVLLQISWRYSCVNAVELHSPPGWYDWFSLPQVYFLTDVFKRHWWKWQMPLVSKNWWKSLLWPHGFRKTTLWEQTGREWLQGNEIRVGENKSHYFFYNSSSKI